jgi:hypothetical protein
MKLGRRLRMLVIEPIRDPVTSLITLRMEARVRPVPARAQRPPDAGDRPR